MAIYGIGANYDRNRDVSQDFIDNNIIGTGWTLEEAPDIHQFIKSLKVGDIVFLKSSSIRTHEIIVKAIGVINNNEIPVHQIIQIGRNVTWLLKDEFRLPESGKNNVHQNTIFEEFDPEIQQEIINKIASHSSENNQLYKDVLEARKDFQEGKCYPATPEEIMQVISS